MGDRADALVKLALKEFRRRYGEDFALTKAEERMLRAAAEGKPAVCTTKALKDVHPENAKNWPKSRSIRAEVLRWVCVDAEARRRVDPKGVQVAAARIDGALDLGSAHVGFPLSLRFCALPDGVDFTDARTRTLDFEGSHVGQRANQVAREPRVSIHAEGVSISGALGLNGGFVAHGEVCLLGARITGLLACTGGSFLNPKGEALTADAAEIGAGAFFEDPFEALGEVRLLGARIKGNLQCKGGKFINPNRNPNRVALTADNAHVAGTVFLNDGFAADGEVHFVGARIGGQLACNGGKFCNPGRMALIADGVDIGAGAFFRGPFKAVGEVRLTGASIRGNLECTAGKFSNPKGYALRADAARIAGVVFLDGGFSADGLLDLADARCDVLKDAPPSWPGRGKLLLNGFEYGSLAPGSPTDAVRRRDWLLRQYPPDPRRPSLAVRLARAFRFAAKRARVSGKRWQLSWWTTFLPGLALSIRRAWRRRRRSRRDAALPGRRSLFRPQPYSQLAEVLRGMGHDGEARKILILKEDHRRTYGTMGPVRRFGHRLHKVTVGYGYRPEWAIVSLLVFVVLGTVFFWTGKANGLMVPARERVYTSQEYVRTGAVPEEYPAFCPLTYALDAFVPLLDLHQESHWQPLTRCRWGWALWVYLWLHIIFGWGLTTAVVAGLTRLIRRER